MEVYQTEAQQWQTIIQFFNRYKKIILGTLLIVILGYLAGQYYRHHQQVQNDKASEAYTDIAALMNQDDKTLLKRQGEAFVQEYKRSPYSSLVLLMLAKSAVDSKEFNEAKNYYQAVIDQKSNELIAHIASLRLARIYHVEGDNEKALSILNGYANGYTPLYSELKGDIYMALGDTNKATAAYQEALKTSKQETMSPWLKLKLEALGNEDVISQLS